MLRAHAIAYMLSHVIVRHTVWVLYCIQSLYEELWAAFVTADKPTSSQVAANYRKLHDPILAEYRLYSTRYCEIYNIHSLFKIIIIY